MAADLHGIRNVGDFFSQHYLDQLLEKDLGELLSAWAARENAGKGQSPPKRLAALANVYFKQAAAALEETSDRRRLACAQEFHAHLLDALGYERAPGVVLLESGECVPLVGRVDHDRKPLLWLVEAPFGRAEREATSEEDDSPFRAAILPEQLPSAPGDVHAANDGAGHSPQPSPLSWGELFDGPLFHGDEPARWVIYLAGSDAFLIDRLKWPQGKYLHFELGTLFGRRETAALRAVAALLHRDALIPEGGTSLLERLDEASHKHAFGVSTDLKWGVQRSVERLANEALHYRRTILKKALFDDSIDPTALSRECIVYLYRLLFLFYVESRSDLGVVPMAADAYRLGYSLEALRDLEQVPLLTPGAQNGFFIHESLQKLFELVQEGHLVSRSTEDQLSLNWAEPLHGTFDVCGLGSPLFDPKTTPILSSVRLRNSVLQQVIQDLSLSREKRGNERGRISYSQLGINQLGAVYERLLSYTGFFAKEKLYEVRAATEVQDEDARTYFVPESTIADYKEDEKVRDEAGRPVQHDKGTFLFRLAGRDREKNASYYTPEVLTRCLTKYTLKVRLGEPLMKPLPGEELPPEDAAQKPLSADEILNLTICEPAMGSGAFLNEAVNQLAHKYLEKKQAELGKTIPADQYQREWAKVKYHFVAHQVYGVDLNPLAADLGKISLWLNALVPCVPPPFLEPRIGVGNSLIGARREVFLAEKLAGANRGRRGGTAPWLKEVPLRVPLGPGGFQPRPEGSVYHFLLPDEDMAAYADDRVVKELVPEQAKALREWRKALCAPLSAEEIARLQSLSDRVDKLWQQHITDRQQLLRDLRQPIGVWGQSVAAPGENAEARWKTVAECEVLARRLEEPTAAGQRLRAVMDYWCALWFWPLLEAEHAPARSQWIADVESVLSGDVELSGTGKAPRARSRVLADVVGRQRFFHWELQFADVFAQKGGLDVFLGNPPWLKVEWKEAGILGDLEPLFTLRGLSATQMSQRRTEAVYQHGNSTPIYLRELESTQGTGTILNALQNYPLLQKTQTNLYKCFLVQASALKTYGGAAGLIHQKGIYDDPKAGSLREHLLEQLGVYLHFVNKLMLFPEIKDEIEYEMSILGGEARTSCFTQLSNLLHPSTIEASFNHSGLGPVPGIKTDESKWDLRGHRSRIVRIDAGTLALFAKLYDAPKTPASQARLAVVHSQEILEVLKSFAEAPRRLGDLNDEYFCTEHFHETKQQDDGTIQEECRVPRNVQQWVVSGPHFYVANPFSNTANQGCRNGQDYSAIDLTQIGEDYLPRANFIPACAAAEYRRRTPHWQGKLMTEFYRHVHREMVRPARARTLVPSVIPPGAAHIHTVFSIAFRSPSTLLLYSALCSAVPIDFFVKSTGMGHVNKTLSERLPLFAPVEFEQWLIHRALRLNCLTTHYTDLWNEVATPTIKQDGFAKRDPRLLSWRNLTPTWHRDSALRTPYERRQALVELDALAALSLGLTEEQLLLIYRVQFPVLQQYERETFYDQRGKIIFTVNKGLSGVGLTRAQWDEVKHAKAGDKLPDFARDAGGPFIPPFDACDREQDMAQAYRHFAQLLGKSDLPDTPIGSVRKPSPPPPPAANDIAKAAAKSARR